MRLDMIHMDFGNDCLDWPSFHERLVLFENKHTVRLVIIGHYVHLARSD